MDWPAVTAGSVIPVPVRLKKPYVSVLILEPGFRIERTHEFPCVIVGSSAVETAAFAIAPAKLAIVNVGSWAPAGTHACIPEKTSIIVPPLERFGIEPLRV